MKSHFVVRFLCVGAAALFLSVISLNAQENDDFDFQPDIPETADEQALEPAEFVPEDPAPVAEAPKDEEFELDRSEVPAAVVEPEPPEDPPRRSFFGRLFRGRERPPEEEIELPEIDEEPEIVEDEDLSPEEELALQEEMRRQALEIQAMRRFKEADKAIAEGDYSLALSYLSEGLSVMPVRPQTMAIREDARKKQANCEYRLALNHYRQGRLQEARDAIRRAQGYYPADRRPARLAERISREEARLEEVAAKPVHPRDTEEQVERRARVASAVKRGRQFLELKDYEKAKYEFRSALMVDPLDEEATAGLKRIADREYKQETKRFDAFHRDMMAQVRAAWTPPVSHEIEAPEIRPDEVTIVSPRRRRLMEKLNNIVIPQLDFRQANIVDVVQYLVQQSIAGDTVSPPAERGVNIILNLKRPGEVDDIWEAPPFRPDADDPFAVEEPAIPAAARRVPLITLSLRNILLIDAIKYITEVTGLRYRVEDDAVVITPADVVVGTVITRTYRVQPTITDIIMTGTPERDDFLGFVEARPERADVRSFFVEAGVPFPEGTSIVYRPSINLLIVSNTEENLEQVERILATLDVIPTQVEIEARFVEVGQRDLMELGAEWRLRDDWVIAQEAGAGAPVPISARERIQMDKNIFTKGLRQMTREGTLAPSGDMAGILSISSVLTNPELTFILHALEQRTGVNLLSAPKVTTKSGANAEIKVVQELIYPTAFDIIEAPVAAGYEGIVPRYTSPSAFEVRDLGVVLNVTPIVAPDGYTIDLTMIPQVVELQDWVNYGSTLFYEDGSSEQVNILQPIFHSRSIATSISIWDGQTVVMGGLITETQVTVDDKVPFLGDIPLIGALFRSKITQSEKRNLLIFVTARLVDPAGVKVHTATAGPTGR